MFRDKFIKVFAAVMGVISIASMIVMLSYSAGKTVIVNEDESLIETDNSGAGEAEEMPSVKMWKISVKEPAIKSDSLHFPKVPTDVYMNVNMERSAYKVVCPHTSEAEAMDILPYGSSEYIESVTGMFDGEKTTFLIETNAMCACKYSYGNGEMIVNFAPLSSYEDIVVIDPGHGGDSNGTIVGDICEKNLTLDVARKVCAKSFDKDYLVVLTRDTDVYMDSNKRAEATKLCNADYYVGIHSDVDMEDRQTFGMRAEYNALFFRDGFENVDFAKCILDNVAESASNRAVALSGCTEDDAVPGLLTIPGATLYVGYLSNETETGLLDTDEYREKIADGIINALDELTGR